MKNSHTRKIVTLALLIALEIVLTRILKIEIPPVAPVLRLSFGFVSIAIMAILYGPIYAGFAAAIADFIGFLLFPTAGASYFPGFAFTAFLIGVVYGLLLHKKPAKLWRICVAALIVTVGLQFVLDTIWLTILLERAVISLIPVRAFRTVVMLPLQIVCLKFITSDRFKFIFQRA
jgi:ECF transporter S component (folate family)